MQIKEFSQPITSKQLNENAAKTFGYKLNLEQFSDIQLEDARNKLRTKLSQFELSESFDSILESPDYQKTRMFLDVINQEITEREMTAGEKEKEKEIKSKTDKSGMKKSMKKQYGKEKGENVYFATIRKRAMSESVPQAWINSALSRIELGESDRAELKAELKLRYDLNESAASWVLLEGEENKAEIIMATKDMVDRITGWLEDVATMKAEQLLELLDSIREEMGSDVAEQYSQAIKPALENIYSTLESTRQSLSQGLGVVSGNGGEMMGTGPAPDLGGMPGEEPAMGEPELPPVAEPGMGDEGRMKRESVDYSRRLSQILNTPKKK